MEAGGKHGRTLRATLCEIERGVFYATYHPGEYAPGTGELPTYQIGKSAVDAKRQIEQSARAIGYDSVSWTESIIAPLFPAHAGTVHREPAAAHAVRHRV